jgi:hypothetical protein
VAHLQDYAIQDGLPIGSIAFPAGRVCGAAALKVSSIASHAHLSARAGLVQPAMRRQGIGCLMLGALEDLAPPLGCASIYCGTSASQDRLHRREWQLLENTTYEGKGLGTLRKFLWPVHRTRVDGTGHQMSARAVLVPVSVAAIVGAVLWFAAAMLSGRREAWDGAAYWALAYPAAILVCAYLGYSHPDRPWRWALVLFQAQFIAMCVRNGELGSLWPLGVMMFAAIALPGIVVATLSAHLRSRPGEGAT